MESLPAFYIACTHAHAIGEDDQAKNKLDYSHVIASEPSPRFSIAKPGSWILLRLFR
jgi:hypothetical protein